MANICRGRKPTKISKAGRGKEEEEEEEEQLETSGGGKDMEEEENHFQTFLLHHLNQLHPPPPPRQPSVVPQNKKQKTVPGPGDHIVVGSTGCKDRHNKVSTAKGLRDRRVRLSAHTAIEFYDVQDRLGYDRPSMAVDWLIENAKSAIDRLPSWGPTSVPTSFQEDHTTTNNNNTMFTSSNGTDQLGGYFDHHFFAQREPLQSSAPPSWMDPIASTSLYGSGSGGGFSGFRVPSWIQGSGEQDSASHLQ